MRQKFVPVFNVGRQRADYRKTHLNAFRGDGWSGETYWQKAIKTSLKYLALPSRKPWMGKVKTGTWHSEETFFAGYVKELFQSEGGCSIANYVSGVTRLFDPAFAVFEDFPASYSDGLQESSEEQVSGFLQRLEKALPRMLPEGTPYLFVCVVRNQPVAVKTALAQGLRTANFPGHYEVHCHFVSSGSGPPAPPDPLQTSAARVSTSFSSSGLTPFGGSSFGSRSRRSGGGQALSANIATEALEGMVERAEEYMEKFEGVQGSQASFQLLAEQGFRLALGAESQEEQAQEDRFLGSELALQHAFFTFQFFATHGVRSVSSPLTLAAAGRLATSLHRVRCCMEEEAAETQRLLQTQKQPSGRFTAVPGVPLGPDRPLRPHSVAWGASDGEGAQTLEPTRQMAALLEDTALAEKRSRGLRETQLLFLLLSAVQRAPALLSISPVFSAKVKNLFLVLYQNHRSRTPDTTAVQTHLAHVQQLVQHFQRERERTGSGPSCSASGLDFVLARLQLFLARSFENGGPGQLEAIARTAIDACTLPPAEAVFAAVFVKQLLQDCTSASERPDFRQNLDALVLERIARSSDATKVPASAGGSRAFFVAALNKIGTNLAFGHGAVQAAFPRGTEPLSRNVHLFPDDFPDLLNYPTFLGHWTLAYCSVLIETAFKGSLTSEKFPALFQAAHRFCSLANPPSNESTWPNSVAALSPIPPKSAAHRSLASAVQPVPDNQAAHWLREVPDFARRLQAFLRSRSPDVPAARPVSRDPHLAADLDDNQDHSVSRRNALWPPSQNTSKTLRQEETEDTAGEEEGEGESTSTATEETEVEPTLQPRRARASIPHSKRPNVKKLDRRNREERNQVKHLFKKEKEKEEAQKEGGQRETEEKRDRGKKEERGEGEEEKEEGSEEEAEEGSEEEEAEERRSEGEKRSVGEDEEEMEEEEADGGEEDDDGREEERRSKRGEKNFEAGVEKRQGNEEKGDDREKRKRKDKGRRNENARRVDPWA
mmetsp:Transcript_3270/g.4750  ORF Transcript_3270/g.4750 Transcript_3270/m.4750 type:complete len:999 (-) Transcript_3270:140-3136(-)